MPISSPVTHSLSVLYTHFLYNKPTWQDSGTVYIHTHTRTDGEGISNKGNKYIQERERRPRIDMRTHVVCICTLNIMHTQRGSARAAAPTRAVALSHVHNLLAQLAKHIQPRESVYSLYTHSAENKSLVFPDNALAVYIYSVWPHPIEPYRSRSLAQLPNRFATKLEAPTSITYIANSLFTKIPIVLTECIVADELVCQKL